MKFLQSKRVRRILLFTGLLLLGVGAYVGYEIYTVNKALDAFGEALVVFANLADAFASVNQALPDSTAAIDSITVFDSTQVVADSLIVQ